MSFGFKAKSINGEGSKGRKGSRVTLLKSKRTTKQTHDKEIVQRERKIENDKKAQGASGC
jgi:hypothetical protein